MAKSRLRNRNKVGVEVQMKNGSSVIVNPNEEIFIDKLSDVKNLDEVRNKLEVKTMLNG